MNNPEQSYDLNLLFAANRPRLAHMRDASAFARDIASSARLSPEHAAFLERAALLHDIGYAPALQYFNFHPLDGAIFLEKRQEHPWVVEGVLRHSMADRKAATMPRVAEQYAGRPVRDEAQWLVRAVTLADWRAAGIGGRASFGQRLDDILTRNPDNPRKAARATEMVRQVRHWFVRWICDLSLPTPLPWIFSDVDNTLIRPGQSLLERNKDAIRAYIRHGGKFSLATGKHPRSILALAEELHVADLPHIAVNGACVVHGSAVRILADLPHETVQLADRLESMGLPVVLYRSDGIEAGRWWTDMLNDLFEQYGEIRPTPQKLSGPLLKILCIVTAEDAQREHYLRGLADEFDVTCCRSDTQFLEFLPDQGNKGAALRALLLDAGWPMLHSVAVGDAENDASMFAQCGMCAAVANAQPVMLRGADWIIPACHEAGIGHLIDALLPQGWLGFGAEVPKEL